MTRVPTPPRRRRRALLLAWAFAAVVVPAAVATGGVWISAGPDTACSVNANWGVNCWGRLPYGGPPVPAEGVCVGDGHGCMQMKGNGSVACWGVRGTPAAVLAPPQVAFVQIACGTDYTCGITVGGPISCWGAPGHPAVAAAPVGGVYAYLAAGPHFACATKDHTQLVTCWGVDSGAGELAPPAGLPFQMLALGARHACGTTVQGLPACWGDNSAGQATATTDHMWYVAAAGNWTAWMRASGNKEVVILGDTRAGQGDAITPSNYTRDKCFQNMRVWALAPTYGCGVGCSQEVYCWGTFNGVRQTLTPAGGGGQDTYAWANRSLQLNACSGEQYGTGFPSDSCTRCGMGYVGMASMRSCVECPPGWYNPLTSRSVCVKCAAGTYTSAPASPTCSPCTAAPGAACPVLSTSPAGVLCAAGSYCAGGAAPAVLCSCTWGFRCDVNASSVEGSLCPAGSYCPGGPAAAVPCGAAGYWCPPGSGAPNAAACAAGHFGTAGGAAGYASAACGGACTAPPGSFCPAGSSSPGGVPCALGSVCAGGSSAPVACAPAAGYYTIAAAPSCGTAATPCAPGYYGDARAYGTPSCAGACTGRGGYCPPASTDGAGLPCPLGYYCADPAVPPVPCPPGVFGGAPRLAGPGCSGPCTAGYYCPLNSTSSTQAACAPGRYAGAGAGSPACDGLCPPGAYCAGPAAAAPTPCAAGRYGAVPGLTTATCSGMCPNGYHCDAGSSNATGQLCPGGYFCPAGNATATPCSLGNWGGPDPWAFADATCSGPCAATPGHYCPPGSTSERGVPCPAGNTCPSMGAPVPCTALAGGLWCPAGLASTAGARPCDAGYYGVAARGYVNGSCAGPCAPSPGHYCPAGSSSSGGSSCGPGSFSDGTDMAACMPCAPGTASSASGAVSGVPCAPCGANAYSEAGAAACIACDPAVYAGGSTGAPSPPATVTAAVTRVVPVSGGGGGALLQLTLVVTWTLAPGAEPFGRANVTLSPPGGGPPLRLTVAAPSTVVSAVLSLPRGGALSVGLVLENCYGPSSAAVTWVDVHLLDVLENTPTRMPHVPCGPGEVTRSLRVEPAHTTPEFLAALRAADVCGGGGANLSYAPALNYNGPDAYVQTIGAGGGGAASRDVAVYVTVAFVNQAPVVTPSIVLALTTDSDAVALDLAPYISDVELPDAGLRLVNVTWDPRMAAPPTVSGLQVTVLAGLLSAPLTSVYAYRWFAFYVDDGIKSTYGNVTLGVACGVGSVPNTWSTGELCLPCPAGASCYANGSAPLALPGWMSHAEPHGVRSFLACVPADKCAGRDRCGAGYAGPSVGCSACAPLYYRSGAACLPCPAEDVLSLVLLGIVAFVLLTFISLMIASGVETAYVTIAINFFQTISLIKVFQLNWPPLAVSAMSIVSFANFNLDLVRPECSIPNFNWWDRYGLVMLSPPIVMLLLFLGVALFRSCKAFLRSTAPAVAPLRELQQRLERTEAAAAAAPVPRMSLWERALQLRWTARVWLLGATALRVLFLTLSTHAIAFFKCTPVGTLNVEYVFDADTSMRCDSPYALRTQFIALGVLLLLFYVVGIPLALARSLRASPLGGLWRAAAAGLHRAHVWTDAQPAPAAGLARLLLLPAAGLVMVAITVHGLLSGAGALAWDGVVSLVSRGDMGAASARTRLDAASDALSSPAALSAALRRRVRVPLGPFRDSREVTLPGEPEPTLVALSVGKDYKPDAMWWELCVITRKLAILVTHVLADSTDPHLEGMIVLLILLGAVAVHVTVRPYHTPALNTLEFASLLVTACVMMLGVLFSINAYPPPPATGSAGFADVAGGLIFAAIIVFLVIFCVLLVTIAYRQYAKYCGSRASVGPEVVVEMATLVNSSGEDGSGGGGGGGDNGGGVGIGGGGGVSGGDVIFEEDDAQSITGDAHVGNDTSAAAAAAAAAVAAAGFDEGPPRRVPSAEIFDEEPAYTQQHGAAAAPAPAADTGAADGRVRLVPLPNGVVAM